MEHNLITSVSPHVFAARDTRGIMLEVIIALAPAAIAGTVIFGISAAVVMAVCIASCVLSEYLFNKICKRRQSAGDLSAVVTGLLLGMNLPANIPLWMAVVGSFAAIVVVKCLFGGIGYNFANPAITARVIMLIAFTDAMTAVCMPLGVDEVASATPLGLMKKGIPTGVSLRDMLLGVRAGALGETCAVALIAGGIFLIVRKIIMWQTPVFFIGTVFAFSFIVTGSLETALFHVLSGGLLIGAFFMATDYVTSPATPKGKMIFGIGCGIITCLIRFYGSYPEGVSFSILMMNILSPYIDKWTMLKPFGGEAK